MQTSAVPRRARLVLWACAAVGFAACQPADDADAPDRDGADAAAATGRADTVDTLSIEGQAEPVRVRDWRTPPDFPLPFRTRLPERVRASSGAEGEQAWVRFDFDSGTADSVYMRVLVLPEGTDANDARALARAIATDFGPIGSQGLEYTEGRDAPAYDWAQVNYRLRGFVRDTPVTGSLALARHGDRFFTVMQLYPPEYGDGAGVRFDYIRSEWRWLDTGSPLSRTRRLPDVVETEPDT